MNLARGENILRLPLFCSKMMSGYKLHASTVEDVRCLGVQQLRLYSVLCTEPRSPVQSEGKKQVPA